MSMDEHVQIFSGKKLIVEGDHWIPRVGKCKNCSDVAKLPDDMYCQVCREKLYLLNIRELPIAQRERGS